MEGGCILAPASFHSICFQWCTKYRHCIKEILWDTYALLNIAWYKKTRLITNPHFTEPAVKVVLHVDLSITCYPRRCSNLAVDKAFTFQRIRPNVIFRGDKCLQREKSCLICLPQTPSSACTYSCEFEALIRHYRASCGSWILREFVLRRPSHHIFMKIIGVTETHLHCSESKEGLVLTSQKGVSIEIWQEHPLAVAVSRQCQDFPFSIGA